MKAFTLTLMFIAAAMSQTVNEVVVEDSGKKTEAQVIAGLECLSESKWNDFLSTNMPDLGVEFIRAQVKNGASPNKKYYIQVNESHNVMYFKEGLNYFIHLNKLNDDGSDKLLMRSFLPDNYQDCIRVLPMSCKWKGQRVVKYIEVCEKGMVQADNFGVDVFNVMIDDDQGIFRPKDIICAIRDCYQPNVYSIAYKCFQDKLYFDPKFAAEYLRTVQAQLEQQGFATKVNLEDFTIDNDWDVQN